MKIVLLFTFLFTQSALALSLNCQRSTLIGTDQGKLNLNVTGEILEFTNSQTTTDIFLPGFFTAYKSESNYAGLQSYESNMITDFEILIDERLITTNTSDNFKPASGTIYFDKKDYSKSFTFHCVQNLK